MGLKIPMPYKDPDRKREYQRRWYARRRANYLQFKFCVWCYSTEDLELDHIDIRTKEMDIKWSYSWTKLKPELDKCQVLCSPCHAIKSDNDMMYMGPGFMADEYNRYGIEIAEHEYGPHQLFKQRPQGGQMLLWEALN